MLSFVAIVPLLFARGVQGLPSGAQVLARCQKAYDSVQTLEEDVKGITGNLVGVAHIRFKRPGKLRVTGKTSMGAGMNINFDLASDGGATWVLNGGTWSRQKNVEMGIASITGTSSSAGTAVPAQLMHTTWGRVALPPGSSPTVTREKIGGRATYKVNTGGTLPRSIWIDASTYFLVKTHTSLMGRSMDVEFGPVKVNAPIPDSAFRRP